MKTLLKMFTLSLICFVTLTVAYIFIARPLQDRFPSYPPLEFDDLSMVDSIMSRQNDLIQLLPNAGGYVYKSWKINKEGYTLNGFNLDSDSLSKDSILSAWNLQYSDYEFLKKSSEFLNTLGISEASLLVNNNLSFLYKYEPGYDADYDYIMLKKNITPNNKDMVDFSYPIILAENEKMTLRTSD